MKLSQALKNQPKVLSLEVTTRCNLDCIYCTKKAKKIGDIDLSIELLEKISMQLEQFERIIVCGIGESFLYPEIYNLVEGNKAQKFSIVTNGTIPIDYKRLNVNGNVEMFIFSIDALNQEVLNQISGRYKFESLLRNLDEYDKYYSENKVKINRVLNCTLNEHNLKEILELVEFAHQRGFGTIHFSFPRGKEQFIEDNQQELTNILKCAAKKAAEYGLYFADPYTTCCVYLKWVTPYMAINGDVFSCAETLYIDKKVGNINDMSFSDIWLSDNYKAFQKGQACKACKFLSNCRFELKTN
ncbi:radical SAM protein [Clostridium sp. BNL1100]|uniref:radical SAM/SPASM domain-containing protein n=1 Tax=Clostridium sp. BNL1100 TaxID=755731 RepID=UPI00024A740E|nr:radical SAM protein [Clostridium sp. BNL1100]AEY67263.1 radical SAM additional 4Fe4S-binding domain protein [Clostridium sp. BNL1100]